MTGFGGFPDNFTEYYARPTALNASAHSNSWGCSRPDQSYQAPLSVCTTYDANTASTDRYTHGEQSMLVLFAAGNDGAQSLTGNVVSPSINKNGLSVGASSNSHNSWLEAEPTLGLESFGDVYNAGVLARFSSTGPSPDGRFKPELVAPGDKVISASSSSASSSTPHSPSCSVKSLSGTSMATPVVAGTALLVHQYCTDGFYPSGSAAVADAFTPSAPLVKALLIASGQPVTKRRVFRQSYPLAQPVQAGPALALYTDSLNRTGFALALGIDHVLSIDAYPDAVLFRFVPSPGTVEVRVSAWLDDNTEEVDLFVSTMDNVDDVDFQQSAQSIAGVGEAVTVTGSPAVVYVYMLSFTGSLQNVLVTGLEFTAADLVAPYRRVATCATTIKDDYSVAYVPYPAYFQHAQYIFVCPDNCTDGSTVFGTARYLVGSSVCAAAQHYGMIAQGEGEQAVKVFVQLPVQFISFRSSVLNGINSTAVPTSPLVEAEYTFVMRTAHKDNDYVMPSAPASALSKWNPNFATGYGRIQLDTVLPLANTASNVTLVIHSSTANEFDSPEPTPLTASADTSGFCVLVNSSDADRGPLRIALTWFDPEGASLVNDLDLTVQPPQGGTMHGNGEMTRDSVNNVERVVVEAPQRGVYCAHVTASRIASGSPQRYALVSAGPVMRCTLASAAQAAYPHVAGNWSMGTASTCASGSGSQASGVLLQVWQNERCLKVSIGGAANISGVWHANTSFTLWDDAYEYAGTYVAANATSVASLAVTRRGGSSGFAGCSFGASLDAAFNRIGETGAALGPPAVVDVVDVPTTTPTAPTDDDDDDKLSRSVLGLIVTVSIVTVFVLIMATYCVFCKGTKPSSTTNGAKTSV
jgi:hypothetical protein